MIYEIEERNGTIFVKSHVDKKISDVRPSGGYLLRGKHHIGGGVLWMEGLRYDVLNFRGLNYHPIGMNRGSYTIMKTSEMNTWFYEKEDVAEVSMCRIKGGVWKGGVDLSDKYFNAHNIIKPTIWSKDWGFTYIDKVAKTYEYLKDGIYTKKKGVEFKLRTSVFSIEEI